ncbi:hypothetical protein F5883DRAFT_596362 [Diaporthe sp. PMI_573]|nr:hypothetical protein F5883DRAFT_596362 [Diaporthaceae sp. PMI_573]
MRPFVRYLLATLALAGVSLGAECKCTPEDSCWPVAAEWDSFNDTISGNLIKTIPAGSVCYPAQPNYNPDSCNEVISNWTTWIFHSTNPASSPSAKGCDPIYPNGTSINGDAHAGDKGCHLGPLPVYVVKATRASDIQQALTFAKKNNIRVIVKNTGHSGVPRSTGYGSMSIWTHNLQETVFHEKFQPASCTTNATWKGSQMAITVGAGVKDGQLFEFAENNNAVAVGGTNIDVGVAGWATGGGHGFLTGEYGQGADNILEAAVVTPNGDLITANECQNEDIYWAIRGGGGNTFGVIVNMTMKAYPIPKMTFMGVDIAANNGTSTQDWWKFMAKYHALIPALQDQGATGYYSISGPPSSETIKAGISFFLWNASNATVSNVTSTLQQLISENTATVSGTVKIQPFTSLYKLITTIDVPGNPGGNAVTASRLISREAVTEKEDLVAETLAKVGTQAEAPPDGTANPSMSGTLTISHEPVGNALNPAWRRAAVHLITSTSWPDSLPQENVTQIVNDVTYNKLDELRMLDPNSGAYLNEANRYEPGWQWSFFGPNYARLRTIKEKYDPDGVMWGPNTVGSEDWVLLMDGKLCKSKDIFA